MAVRCIRCGNLVEGLSQVCSSCTAQKKAAEAAAREAAVKATTNLCPTCGQEIPRTADACPSCSQSFARTGLTFIPYTPADFFVRLVAWLIDFAAFGIIAGVFIVGTGSITAGLTVSYVIYLVAQVAFWMTLGATPGKLLMGIKIVTVDGDPVTLGHCIMRVIGYAVINFFGNILHLLVLIKEDKRGVQDMMSGTMVVYRDTIPAKTSAGAMPSPQS